MDIEMLSETLRALWLEKENRYPKENDIEIINSGLSPRIINAMYRADIKYVSQLEDYTDEGLLDIKGIGKNCVRDIRIYLEQLHK